MRCIASGIALAKKCNADFTIIWSMNWELNAKFEDIFEPNSLISNHIAYPSSLKYNLLYSVPRKKNLFISRLTQKRYGIVLTDSSHNFFNKTKEGSDDDIVGIVNSTLKDGKDCFIQSGVIFYNFSEELYRELFVANEPIATKVTQILSTLGNRPIGIHIRRSDNRQSILHSPDNLFIEEITKKISLNPKQRFYLATDDESTKTKFTQMFGSAIRVSDEKADRNSRAGIIHAATEMFLLSRMTEILGSHYSSFSEAAALIGNVPLRQLYI